MTPEKFFFKEYFTRFGIRNSFCGVYHSSSQSTNTTQALSLMNIMRLVQVTHIWLVSTESVAVEIIVLNHMEPEPVISADVKFRTMSYF